MVDHTKECQPFECICGVDKKTDKQLDELRKLIENSLKFVNKHHCTAGDVNTIIAEVKLHIRGMKKEQTDE